MSLHIKLKRKYKNIKEREKLALKLVESLKLNIKSESKKSEDESIIYILELNDYKGFLKICNDYESKIFEDIELDFFDDKIYEFVKKKFFIKSLESFFENNKEKIVKMYIDIDEEGDENVLDNILEFNSSGRQFILNILKALEEFGVENEKYDLIEENFNSIDKNHFSKILWEEENIKKFFIKKAKENSVFLSEGSFKLISDSKEKVKKMYKSLIDSLIVKISEEINPVDEIVKKVAEKI